VVSVVVSVVVVVLPLAPMVLLPLLVVSVLGLPAAVLGVVVLLPAAVLGVVVLLPAAVLGLLPLAAALGALLLAPDVLPVFGVPVLPMGVVCELCWPAPTAGSFELGFGGVP
jgi:hypothetical protein